MSLLRLLTTGKSLVDVSGEESRYRLTSQKLFPQFRPARNPFSSRAKAEPAQMETRSPEDHGGNGASVARPSLPGPRGEPAAVLQRVVEHRVVPAKFELRKLAGDLWQRMAAVPSGWRTKLSGLLEHSHGKETKSAIPRFPKPPVQGELSLERIKVMRNDLSDADLEVVPAKLLVPPEVAVPAPRAVELTGGTKRAWGRVTTRFWGAGKTLSDEDR
jgi:hypothetical protein